MNNYENKLNDIRHYVQTLFRHDCTGHDFSHMQRVARMAKEIAYEENANEFICEAAGLLHDVGDHKLFSDPLAALQKMESFLISIQLTSKEITQINQAMKDVSFSKGTIPKTLEGLIVQDADRLDAIGAIGIARTFAYGGAKNRIIFHEINKENTTIQHFYDKLFKVKDLINTDYAKKIARERHLFMEEYVRQFMKEW